MPAVQASRPGFGWLSMVYYELDPVIAPVVMVLVFHSRREGFWNWFLVTIIYMSATSAAFICLTGAIATPRRSRVSTVAIVAAAWAVVNGGWLAVAAALGGKSWWPGLAIGMGSPFLALMSLSSAIIDAPANHNGEMAWALVWSVVYVLIAVRFRGAGKQGTGVTTRMIPRPPFRELLTIDSQV